MIFIGYQGIGKSSIAGKGRFIDLESGNFWVDEKRDDNWYIVYAKMALHLSEQGYHVLTSSHKVLRDYLLRVPSAEKIFVVHPELGLRYKWINRLEERYAKTNLLKDYKELMNAREMYNENITDLINCEFPSIVITKMDYRLEDILHKVIEGYTK